MEFLKLIDGNSAITFILLFSRISAMMAFFPFFSHGSIPVSIKTVFVIFLTFFLFPVSHLGLTEFDIYSLSLAVMGELLLGLIAGVIVNIIFAAMGLAGEQVSFVMGFSMASAIDPITGVSTPVIGRFLTLLSILVLLAFNGHHLMLLFLSKTLGSVELGMFYPKENIWHYISTSISSMFILGFVISFPIIALSLLSDVIFGMLMKTMPQFNLLVVGFPIKIIISFVVLWVILGSAMYIFKNEFLSSIKALGMLFKLY